MFLATVAVVTVPPADLSAPWAIAVNKDGRRVVFARSDVRPADLGVAVRRAASEPVPESEHVHHYRSDLSAWWCETCDTTADYCQQTNPF